MRRARAGSSTARATSSRTSTSSPARRSITVTFPNGKSYKGRLVGSDSSTDLAIVRVSAPSSELTPLQVGNSDAVQVGDPVVAIGSPFGLAGTVTSGIVSALHRSISAPNNFTIANSIQTDAPINHGNSGGPLLNGSAQVIGVNAQIQSDSGGNDGVGFAIPSNTVRSVAAQLIAGKSVAHAYLGVSVRDSSSPLGAELARIFPGTPAAKAGLKAGRRRHRDRRQGDRQRERRLRRDRAAEARQHDDRHLRARQQDRHRQGHPHLPPLLSMSSQHKLIAATVVVAVLAGGGAALAAIELSNGSAATTTSSIASGTYGNGDRPLRHRRGPPGRPRARRRARPRRRRRPLRRRRRLRRPAHARPGPRRGGVLPRALGQALRTQLASGQTLAQIAKAQGKTADGLVAAMVTASKTALDTAVGNGYLTQQQATLIETTMASRLKAFVNGTGPRGPFGGPGGRGADDGNGAPGTGNFGGTTTTT